MSLNKKQTISLLEFFSLEYEANNSLTTLVKLLPSLDEAISYVMGLPDPLNIPKEISDLLTLHYGESIIMATEQSIPAQQPPTATENLPPTEEKKEYSLEDLISLYQQNIISDIELKTHLTTLKVSHEKFTTELIRSNILAGFIPKDISQLKDDWVLLENVKVGDVTTSLMLFSWQPNIVYSCKDIPLGLGLPRTYPQFLEFVKNNSLTILFALTLSVDTGELNPVMLSTSDGITVKAVSEFVESLITNKVALQKFVIKSSCFTDEVWTGLDNLLARVNPQLAKQHKGGMKVMQYGAVSTPLLKAIASHGKALKSSTEVF